VIVLPDTIALAPDVAQLASRLIGSCPEFGHLAALHLSCYRSQAALVSKGRAVAAALLDPEHLGAPAPLRVLVRFYLAQAADWRTPDYVLIVDAALFDGSSDTEQERSVYHELCHLEHRETAEGLPCFDEDGRPALRMRAHDVELFNSESARYPDALLEAAAAAQSALPRLVPDPKRTPAVLM